jgi:hypothetical protein
MEKHNLKLRETSEINADICITEQSYYKSSRLLKQKLHLTKPKKTVCNVHVVFEVLISAEAVYFSTFKGTGS